MVAAETFVNELDAKNQPSIQRVIAALNEGLGKEGVEVADALAHGPQGGDRAGRGGGAVDDRLRRPGDEAVARRAVRRRRAAVPATLGAPGGPWRGRLRPAQWRIFEAVRFLAVAADARRALVGRLRDGQGAVDGAAGGAGAFCDQKGRRRERAPARRRDRRGGASLLRGGASASRRGRRRPRRARLARAAPRTAPSSWPARPSSRWRCARAAREALATSSVQRGPPSRCLGAGRYSRR